MLNQIDEKDQSKDITHIEDKTNIPLNKPKNRIILKNCFIVSSKFSFKVIQKYKVFQELFYQNNIQKLNNCFLILTQNIQLKIINAFRLTCSNRLYHSSLNHLVTNAKTE